MKDHRTAPAYRLAASAKPYKAPAAKGVRELLQHPNGIAALLPAAERLAALQADCRAALPAMFDACSLLQFMSGQLTLSAPNAALAAKLKQHLPRLQDFLTTRGWQVSAIRIKVQAIRLPERPEALPSGKDLPPEAIAAFSDLEQRLAATRGDTALQTALQRLLARRKQAATRKG